MSNTFLSQEQFVAVLAVYGLAASFGRWFPDADLIAADAHPVTYAPTLIAAGESARFLYAVSLGVNIVRTLTLGLLEGAFFAFGFDEEKFESCNYFFLLASMVSVTKDLMLAGVVYAIPEVNMVAAEKAAEFIPVAAKVDLGFLLFSLVCLAKGLYQWTYAIGRDKRQVIKEKKDQ
ncbi:hypothetical protein DFQ26_009658 [Actinomortierella ambigua]|nr:hypothetical protein DFQ26_009658 [Actinomortierella ambigua]